MMTADDIPKEVMKEDVGPFLHIIAKEFRDNKPMYELIGKTFGRGYSKGFERAMKMMKEQGAIK